ncbi:DUF2863 family protein [Chitinilyticum piscinae]|uniref:DUF2863 family protein n=1 Tax=Chitinilyticum piscinae TaxID=2866724 RepID=A0A8J7FMW0_9NEIS|nr:DUF2863 family protein [Chitinilyticum piscinae]MBE9609511.1 DUF2863 family protein [Chitinilyticum piscinae]
MLKRPRTPRRNRRTADLDELIRLANGLADSCTRPEDEFWIAALDEAVLPLLEGGDEESLNVALETLAQAESDAWSELANAIEAACETRIVQHDGQDWQVVLLAAPLLSWSRYAIPTGALGRELLQTLRVQLGAHILARGTRLALVDYLFSPDQLPQGFCPTYALLQEMAPLAVRAQDLALADAALPETAAFLSDSRYIVAAVAAPLGQALFRWQEDDGERKEAEVQWRKQGAAALTPVFAGCAMEALLPQAYFAAWRETDRASRAYSIRATVSFLQLTLNLEARQISAAVAACYKQRLEEYRIGFMLNRGSQVVHGVVWPLLDGENEHSDCIGEIEAILRECGISTITVHDHSFPCDHCDDCGSPLFPNSDGELLHTEPPEEAQEQAPQHLH